MLSINNKPIRIPRYLQLQVLHFSKEHRKKTKIILKKIYVNLETFFKHYKSIPLLFI